MPYTIKYKPVKSKKNWAIIDRKQHIVGRSKNEENAKASVRARLMGEHKRKEK